MVIQDPKNPVPPIQPPSGAGQSPTKTLLEQAAERTRQASLASGSADASAANRGENPTAIPSTQTTSDQDKAAAEGKETSLNVVPEVRDRDGKVVQKRKVLPHSATPNPHAPAPKPDPNVQEPEMVQATQFMDQNGKRYFAVRARHIGDMEFPLVTKMVEKDSEEDNSVTNSELLDLDVAKRDQERKAREAEAERVLARRNP